MVVGENIIRLLFMGFVFEAIGRFININDSA